jgi:hypothetical protein
MRGEFVYSQKEDREIMSTLILWILYYLTLILPVWRSFSKSLFRFFRQVHNWGEDSVMQNSRRQTANSRSTLDWLSMRTNFITRRKPAPATIPMKSELPSWIYTATISHKLIKALSPFHRYNRGGAGAFISLSSLTHIICISRASS